MDIDKKHDTIYKKGEQIPFSGYYKEYYPGSIKMEGKYLNGLRVGKFTYYSAECSDISIGDPWHMLGHDQDGSSLVLIRSKKGEDVINTSESSMTIKEVTNFEEVMQFHELNSQIKQQNKKRLD